MDLLIDFQTQIPEKNNIYRRRRLLSTLDQLSNDSGPSLALISAPAGFGKSTLASDWLKANDYSAAWLSLDDNIKEPLIFIKGIIAAFTKNNDYIFQNTKAILKMPIELDAKKTAYCLIKDLEKIDAEINLVIDNLDLVETEFIFSFLNILIKYMPENINLIIISRKEIPFLIKRQELKGELIIIKKDDLKFNYLELKNLIKKEKKLDLEEAEIEELYQITEGWPLVIEFLFFKLLSDPGYKLDTIVNPQNIENHKLYNYLNQKIFSELEDMEKEFLIKTAVVETFSVELAVHLTNIKESNLLLEQLLKKNIFIEVLDNKNKFFRYHKLFRSFLISQLKAEEIEELYLKAAAWFEENKYYKEAVMISLKSKDDKLVVKYLEKSAPLYLNNGELKELISLLNLIQDSILKNSSLLLIIKALSLFVLGKKENAAYYLNLVKNKKDLSPENRGRLLTLSAFLHYYQDADTHCNSAAEALDLISDNDYLFKTNALMTLGQIQSAYQKIDESIDSFRRAYFLARENEQFLLEINSLMNLILKMIQKGDLNEALTLNLENIKRLKKNEGASRELINLLSITLGVIYYFKADYKNSKKHLIKGIEAGEFFELINVYWLPMIYYALSSFNSGEFKLAGDIIKETMELCSKYDLEVNYKLADIENLNFDLARENKKVNPLLRKKIISYADIIDQDTFFMLRVRASFLVSALMIKESNYSRALKYLNIFEYSKLDYVDRIRFEILKAFINLKMGAKNKSREFLLNAVLLLEKEAYLAVIDGYRIYLKSLLAEFDDLNQGILAEVNLAVEVENLNSESELIEPLTEREKEIIELLAEGLSNKKIAEKLFITEGTTKWHLSNIYSKLAVRNRTKAAAKARKLNII